MEANTPQYVMFEAPPVWWPERKPKENQVTGGYTKGAKVESKEIEPHSSGSCFETNPHEFSRAAGLTQGLQHIPEINHERNLAARVRKLS